MARAQMLMTRNFIFALINPVPKRVEKAAISLDPLPKFLIASALIIKPELQTMAVSYGLKIIKI